MANLAARVPKTSWSMVAALVRSIFEQPDHGATWAQLGIVVDKLNEAGLGDVGVLLAEQTDEWAIAKRYMSQESLRSKGVAPKNEPATELEAAAG
ncbi:MAG: hypothetical protein M0Z95_01820 [Actinomycetota bacterium]|nr:hypothetical protein [Actinomycetota bacterium]